MAGGVTFVLTYGWIFLFRPSVLMVGCESPLLFGPWLAAFWIWLSWPEESEAGTGFSAE